MCEFLVNIPAIEFRSTLSSSRLFSSTFIVIFIFISASPRSPVDDTSATRSLFWFFRTFLIFKSGVLLCNLAHLSVWLFFYFTRNFYCFESCKIVEGPRTFSLALHITLRFFCCPPIKKDNFTLLPIIFTKHCFDLPHDYSHSSCYSWCTFKTFWPKDSISRYYIRWIIPTTIF